MTLREASLPLKVLFTCFLLTIGIGYLFAVFYLFLIDIEPHGKEGVGVSQAVIQKYYGKRETTQLEAALAGRMGENITPVQKKEVLEWVRQGAKVNDFPKVEFQEVSAFTQVDTGLSIKSLVRVSHIHLFGISFIFMLTSGVFVMTEIGARWRALLVALPFVAIWVDIGSWWFTKWEPIFAYTVIIGGILMGFSLAAQILIPLWEMWLKKRSG
ncbi:MAG: hypothetical protein HY760_02410 [Nitrospirae bacterium]|nr:hypothetical protein [Nitrospirota bacterium]